MPRIRITLNVVVEYEADPRNYPDGASPQDMLNIDLANAEEDPFMVIGDGKWTTTGELVEAKP